MGINVKSGLISLTFVIASMLASNTGTLVGMYYQSIDINTAFAVEMKHHNPLFGGVGILLGRWWAAFWSACSKRWVQVISARVTGCHCGLVILILQILIKPAGLFGRKNQ